MLTQLTLTPSESVNRFLPDSKPLHPTAHTIEGNERAADGIVSTGINLWRIATYDKTPLNVI